MQPIREMPRARRAIWTAIRDSCRTDFSETSSEPLPLDLPIDLGNDFHVYQGDEIVIGRSKNVGKTLFALDIMRRNMDKLPCTYINSEMRGGELKSRLTALGQAYDIAFEDFKAKIEFFDCRCNAMSQGDMDQLEALLNPNGCNLIDYVKVTDTFYKVGECLERIHARLNRGIAIIFFQKKPKANELLVRAPPVSSSSPDGDTCLTTTRGLKCASSPLGQRKQATGRKNSNPRECHHLLRYRG